MVLHKVVDKKTGEVKLVRRESKGQIFEDPKKDDIVTYKVKNVVVKTGEGPDDFIVKQKMVEASRVNRAASINSYSGDVGIQNVLKKVALSGQDLGTVIDSGKFYSKQGYVDISKMPDNIVDAYKAVEKGVKAFDQLPEDLKKKASFAKFAQDFNEEDFNKYIDAKVEARINAMKKAKEEPKKEGE